MVRLLAAMAGVVTALCSFLISHFLHFALETIIVPCYILNIIRYYEDIKGYYVVKPGPKKKPAKDLKQVMAIRVKPGTKAALKKAAEEDSLPTALFTVRIIENWLKERGYLK